MTIAAGSIKAVFNATHQSTNTDHSTPVDALAASIALAISNGTGAKQANVLWHDQRTIAAAANDDLDLSGSLTDRFGASLALTRIVAILIVNRSTTNRLKVGGSPSNPITSLFLASGDGFIIRPAAAASAGNYSFALLGAADATAYAVAGGSADTLRLTHANDDSTSLVYDIYLIGS